MSACTTQNNAVAPEPPAPSVTVKPAEPSAEAIGALQTVRDTYAAGDYGKTIRLVATDPRLQETLAIYVESLKLSAFSYCLTKYPMLCREQFMRILEIDPAFELAPAERSHPMWGKEFIAAQDARKK